MLETKSWPSFTEKKVSLSRSEESYLYVILMFVGEVMSMTETNRMMKSFFVKLSHISRRFFRKSNWFSLKRFK